MTCALAGARLISKPTMSDESDPPRKFFQLKPKEFDRVNAPVSAAPADSSPTDVSGHIQAANAGTVVPPKARPRPPAPVNDIQAILRDNLSRADAAGLNELTPKPKRRSRRTRDFWLLLVPLNAFCAFAAFGPWANAVSFVYGLAGIILISVGLTWVMWFVMDDY